MKTAIKTIFFIGFTILLLFVLNQNKEIKKLHQNEKEYHEALDFLDNMIDSLNLEIKDLLKDLDSVPEVIFERVKATMYHPVEEQCDNTPLITADGSKIDPYNVSDWNWIAVSNIC